jgi:hypothetical protein
MCAVLKPDEDDHELWASCYPMDSSDPEYIQHEVLAKNAPAALIVMAIDHILLDFPVGRSFSPDGRNVNKM